MNDASIKEPLQPAPVVADEVDPELLALPAPPEGRRIATMAVMALAVVVALGLTSALRHDVAYFFASSAVSDVGNAAELAPATLASNSFVQVEGTPMASQVVRYRRLLSGETFVVFPLAGQRTVFVHMPEAAMASPRATYSGRLVTFGEMGGRLDGVRSFFSHELSAPVTTESYVLLVDESPPTAWWALALSLFCVLFVLVDVWLLVRWFRPIAPPS
ncbi:MAG: hypothetical protein K1X94_28555 [Sandaracinaceae bacterium]|nr:hypothetical protein [Sandaracinaceae bacterium]